MVHQVVRVRLISMGRLPRLVIRTAEGAAQLAEVDMVGLLAAL